MAGKLKGIDPQPAGDRAISLSLRSRLALTTILAVVPFLGYGRQAYAICDTSGAPDIVCTGTITGDNLNFDNADVNTVAPFEVTTDGLYISGDGHIQFTDYSASIINNDGGNGLDVRSTGNYNGTDGAVTIITNGTITGSTNGIFANVSEGGSLSITASGQVTGYGDDGIHANLSSTGDDLTVTTDSASVIRGGDYGIYANSTGDGDLTVIANGEVAGETADGIYAWNAGVNLTVTTGAQSNVLGGNNGIFATSRGEGDLEITADGNVTAYGALDDELNGGDGIFAENGTSFFAIGAQNLTITTGTASAVTGNGDGIDARNYGAGDLSIAADGEVSGQTLDGINAYNFRSGANLVVTAGAGSAITGGDDGIQAVNQGNGNLEITVEGSVTGENAIGISAINSYGYVYDPGDPEGPPIGKNLGIDLTITTSAASVVTGAGEGILANNQGTGNLKIDVYGEVTGGTADGIEARNGEYAGDLTITTGVASTVSGGEDGIEARNFGTGILKIEANGNVTGNGGDGIFARALDGDVEVMTGGGSAVTGFDGNGISAYAAVSPSALVGGDAVVKTQGAVSGTRHGIDAEALGPGGTVLIETSASVTGGANGIDAAASANVTVKAGGDVTGIGEHGINAHAGEGDILVTTAAGTMITGDGNGIVAAISDSGNIEVKADSAVAAGLRGIDAFTNSGTIDITTGAGAVSATDLNGIEATASGNVTITTGGDVRGGLAGIDATSALGAIDDAIKITNNGTVANLSGESTALAITTSGGLTAIDNNGTLIGTVALAEFNDRLGNDGLWNTAGGNNDFGDGHDSLANTGTLRAADGGGDTELTRFSRLESFNNSGLVTLADGKEGDELHFGSSALGDSATDYVGEGGGLAVDAVLGPAAAGGLSDTLWVAGDTGGTTRVSVNVVDATGANTQGIRVVIAGGNTTEEDFDLGGPLNAGFYTWDLRLDDGGETIHELYTSGIGVGAYEFAAGISGAQQVWQQTTGTIMQRQADLRVLFEGMSVTPAADYAEPVEPTPLARITPGFWFNGTGAYVDQDDEEDGFTLDRKQTIWGGLAGFDFGHENAGSAWLFGVFGGYLTSDLEFDETNTEWNYEGPTVGAYVTYLDHAFYADLTVKADFLDIEIDPQDLAPASDDADTDATNVGGRIDTGYKFGETVFVEPQASFAVVHTEIDDVDIFGGTVEFDDETSVRGRLGLRLGFEHTDSTAVIYSGDVTASVWEEFAGDNGVSITDPTFGTFDASDDAGGTIGDVSLGFGMVASEGWSGFIRGNYQFAEDYEAVAGNAGVRFAW
ncbi:autotransporter outer membrane beta-barrel domain-containing protein [Taklimakanibacter deserti]|uniref:autotransporter outer membrane beta-barrel domain-containing protein n=1 Tax=Taklimakanibacter deserti TaxID=2267839 RepID=UPI0013C4BF12